jgi:plastocyanin
MRRRDVLAGLSVAATAGLAGCGGVFGSGCGGDDFDVGMSESAYDPATVTVEVGDTVLWRNTSQRAHTVTGYDTDFPEGAAFFASGGYDSTAAARDAWRDNGGAIYTCEDSEHTFETAGEFPYFCIPHERAGMVGTVVVEK